MKIIAPLIWIGVGFLIGGPAGAGIALLLYLGVSFIFLPLMEKFIGGLGGDSYK